MILEIGTKKAILFLEVKFGPTSPPRTLFGWFTGLVRLPSVTIKTITCDRNVRRRKFQGYMGAIWLLYMTCFRRIEPQDNLSTGMSWGTLFTQ